MRLKLVLHLVLLEMFLNECNLVTNSRGFVDRVGLLRGFVSLKFKNPQTHIFKLRGFRHQVVSRRVPLIWLYCEQDKRAVFSLILLLQLLFHQTKLYVLINS